MGSPTYSLGYLLTKLGRAAAIEYQKRLEPLGITPLQSGILAAVTILGPQKQKDLCHLLLIEKATMNQMLKALKRRELVVFRKDKSDGRAWSISPTRRGEKLTTKIAKIDAEVSEHLARGVSPNESSKLRLLLSTLLQNAVIR